MIIEAADWSCMNMSIAQLWGSGPKVKCKCGNCGSGFSQRIKSGIDNPSVKCPYCDAFNKIPLVWRAGNE